MKFSTRAEKIDPFYVMEVAKAAQQLAQEVASSPEPMIFLNIGEPDYTAPEQVQAAAQPASRQVAPSTPMRWALSLARSHQPVVPHTL